MRRGILGSIAALAAGAGAAWGQQPPMPIAPAGGPPAGVAHIGDVIPVQGPSPTLMPPVTVGPPGDPLGLGPTATLGPPPGPMYPPPGPYTAPLFQPPPPGSGGPGGTGYGDAPKWWVSGEYLLLFPSDQPINFPLVTTGSPNQAGVIGQPTTLTLAGDNDLDYSALGGFRLGFGFFGDADKRFGFQLSGMYSGRGVYDKTVDALGHASIPVIARPFYDTIGGGATPSSLVLVSPNISAANPNRTTAALGSITVRSTTDTWSIEPSAVWNLFRSQPDARLWQSLDVMMGYKFLGIHETLSVNSYSHLTGVTVTPIFQTGPFGVPVQIGTRITPIPVTVGGVLTAAPARVSVGDKFTVLNNFNGVNFAFRHEARYGMFSLTTIGKLAVGHMHQSVRIRGVTAFTDSATGRQGYAFGGLYANTTNIGNTDNDEFGVIPELQMNLGINLTKRLTMFLGYNGVYVNRVVRPGNELNPFINSATVPLSPNYGTATAPSLRASLNQTDFWLHGAAFGLQWRY